jgi:two-component system nitrate/nitrite response regulator NarL
VLSKALEINGRSSEQKMKSVGVCETQPVTAEGLRVIISKDGELEFRFAVSSWAEAALALRSRPPDILMLDKGFGAQAIQSWIEEIRQAVIATAIVVWGNTISESEALRLLQYGVKGIIRKSAPPATVLACLRSVSSGATWMEETLFREHSGRDRYPRSELTSREQQVLELVEQGLKNREIARELGIRPGTVKIHLKHIFEKTGVRGRIGLAINGMKEKGYLTLPKM